MSLASYSFLPWLRTGVANQIAAADGDPAVLLRASVEARVQIVAEVPNAAPVTRDVTRTVELIGPGDVIGIDARAIIRTEPRAWNTSFEPNYVPFVEFYDEDFPWRYTPAAPTGAGAAQRLRPWITLLIVGEDEFENGENVADKPLPFINVSNASVFPPAGELWAWAHVHVNRNLAASDTEIVSTDMAAVMPRFQQTLAENPDLAYSRLVSARRLEANKAYHAFLVPTFETGRLAGLGLDPAHAPNATHSAWAAYTGGTRELPDSHPYYHRWYFRTGGAGDFETLVRLLKPQPVDSRVGTRDIDVTAPGPTLPPIDDAVLGGVLKLGGALRVPREDLSQEERDIADRYERWDSSYPHPFQSALASFINLSDDYSEDTAAAVHAATGFSGIDGDNADPMITPPLYGRWHSLTPRLLKKGDGTAVLPNRNWVHQLNLDPRHRATAQFGTRVVQSNQEDYMEASWRQVGDVLEANRRLRAAQLAKQASLRFWGRHLFGIQAARPERVLVLTAPVQRRVIHGGLTVRHALSESLLSTAIASAPMRRVARPGARLMRSLPFTSTVTPDNLLHRVNIGEVSAAPPPVRPPGIVTVGDAAGTLIPRSIPGPVVGWLRRWPWLWLLFMVLAAFVLGVAWLFGASAYAAAGPIAAALSALGALVRSWATQIKNADSLSEAAQTPGAVAQMPTSSDFHLSAMGAGFTPRAGGSDSTEAIRFKEALVGSYTLVGASAAASMRPVPAQLEFEPLRADILSSIHPDLTIRRRILGGIILPPHIAIQLGEDFTEVMAYPQIDQPMYKPLVDMSADMFVPGLNLIPENSITLLETNQSFIEAYMVGVNHELSRELLWREYPTDQRGSYFRQFWDPSTHLDGSVDDDARREELKDIPPLHTWPRISKLGEHDHRGSSSEDVVLVIRGELLKKYPNAVIYAHRAEWQRKSNGDIDPKQQRMPAKLTEAEEASPPRTKIRSPLYSAKVEPDIYFFGFDLTVAVARGGTGENPTDDPGWFFVIKERPGEPRFGFDESREGALNVWNDLAWADVMPAGGAGAFIPMDGTAPAPTLANPTAPELAEKVPQYNEDQNVSWSPGTSAADIAYIMFQAPVLVAVHAAEMLRAPE